MTSVYAIKDAAGNVTDRIVADAAFMAASFPSSSYVWEGDITEPPPPPSLPMVPTVAAFGTFRIIDGWIESVGVALGFAFSMPTGPGCYTLWFEDEQPDLAYSVYTSSSSGVINIPNRTNESIDVCITSAGEPAEANEFSVQVVRSK